MASEMVSQTLSGWPSPTDSEEKMKFPCIPEIVSMDSYGARINIDIS